MHLGAYFGSTWSYKKYFNFMKIKNKVLRPTQITESSDIQILSFLFEI